MTTSAESLLEPLGQGGDLGPVPSRLQQPVRVPPEITTVALLAFGVAGPAGDSVAEVTLDRSVTGTSPSPRWCSRSPSWHCRCSPGRCRTCWCCS